MPGRARILAVCGSLQARSGNLELLRTAAIVAPDIAEVTIFDGAGDLPLFNPDVEASGVPTPVAAWRRTLAQSDAVLIASPEYGHSLPGALKNAIDWMIGSRELCRRVVAITAAVADPQRGRRGLEALAVTLGAVDAVVAWRERVVRRQGWGADVTRVVVGAVCRSGPRMTPCGTPRSCHLPGGLGSHGTAAAIPSVRRRPAL